MIRIIPEQDVTKRNIEVFRFYHLFSIICFYNFQHFSLLTVSYNKKLQKWTVIMHI